MFDYELNEIDKYYRIDKPVVSTGRESRRISTGAKQLFEDEKQVRHNRKQYKISPQMNVFKRQK